MKVVFITSCIEKGKDGIGDYTQRFASFCKKNSLEVGILAINDKWIVQLEKEQNDIPYLRIPSSFNWNEKVLLANEFINSFNPDWLSLQFVSYGYNPKGFIHKEIASFKEITKGRKLHLMLHELWIGEEKGAGLKNTIIGRIQKYGILRLIKEVNPNIIHTNLSIYQKTLQINHIKASLLPLFSNIPIHSNIDPSKIYAEIEDKLLPERNIQAQRDRCFIIGIFGTLQSNWDLQPLLREIGEELKSFKKEIILVSIGRIGRGIGHWEKLKTSFPNIKFVLLGEKDEVGISSFLQVIDYGIATTPNLLLGKSGSFHAMVEHGVPVFSDRNRFKFKDKYQIEETKDDLLFVVKDQISGFTEKKRKPPKEKVDEITKQFISSLKSLT